MNTAAAFPLAALVKATVVLFAIVGFSPVMTWFERKISALAQDRMGPNRARVPWLEKLPLIGGLFRFLGRIGIVHPVADALKMITKEDFVPDRADKLVHTLAPWIALVPAFVTFAVVPFGPDIRIGATIQHLQVANLEVGILYIFALSSLAPYGAALAGWSSNNKFSLLGALRASAQMISYEVCMGASAIGLFMIYGSLRLEQIVLGQQDLLWGIVPKWGVVVQPLAAILFFAAAYAETKRAPFDTPEGDSEIVAGYFTEYSGMKFGMFYTAEFVEMIVLAGLYVSLFFGGYLIPWVPAGWALTGQAVAGVMVPGFVWALLMLGAFLLKVAFFVFLQFQIRWTLPRFRYDQVMRLGWKILLPLSLANILVTGLVMLW
ncbi:MAG: NADH-quinone oxidoreductase subunit H [Deltaproteobacteria bacterium]|nr:NADH-quinone oxidoreductase subunit H [Deltaproteobacteria bacterium]